MLNWLVFRLIGWYWRRLPQDQQEQVIRDVVDRYVERGGSLAPDVAEAKLRKVVEDL